ncbi:MAG: selenide, water dikinase SelD [Candidatus Eremiobacteraeota bacterium]|nr:selenide, water dikinase SelD [Candidatus Eremiobacteraeota bacterium]
MDASVLAHVLRGLPPITDPNVLVGTSSADDAGVYRLSDTLALVQTLDFFTPIVDDPRAYGRIAAANALSDVYAMGARPISALAIAAFPETMAPAIIHDILAGGAEKAAEAGIAVIGGHTIKDDEPKYGLCVTGVVHPDRFWRNDTGRAGDALILTKPLGTGVLTTARRSDAIDEAAMHEATASMSELNRAAAEALLQFDVHAATDVTGFGMIGHILEMAGAALGAQIDASAVPLLAGALDCARNGNVPGGSRANHRNALERGVRFDASVSPELQLLLCDAQTSGGLLAAVDASVADAALQAVRDAGVSQAARVGSLTGDGIVRIAGAALGH